MQVDPQFQTETTDKIPVTERQPEQLTPLQAAVEQAQAALLHVQHPVGGGQKQHHSQQKHQQKQGKQQHQQGPKPQNPAQDVVDLTKMRDAFAQLGKRMTGAEEALDTLTAEVQSLSAYVRAQEDARAKAFTELLAEAKAQTTAVLLVQQQQNRVVNVIGMTPTGKKELKTAADQEALAGRQLPWLLRPKTWGLLGSVAAAVFVVVFFLVGG